MVNGRLILCWKCIEFCYGGLQRPQYPKHIIIDQPSPCLIVRQMVLQSVICRLLQGMLNTRPPKPKSSHIWDVECVTTHIKNRPSSEELDLKELLWKLVTLLALTNADRASDLHLMDLKYCKGLQGRVIFLLEGLNKTRQSGPTREVFYNAFPDCPNICPVETLRVYGENTSTQECNCNPRLIA